MISIVKDKGGTATGNGSVIPLCLNKKVLIILWLG
jgi:hypothetical protein